MFMIQVLPPLSIIKSCVSNFTTIIYLFEIYPFPVCLTVFWQFIWYQGKYCCWFVRLLFTITVFVSVSSYSYCNLCHWWNLMLLLLQMYPIALCSPMYLISLCWITTLLLYLFLMSLLKLMTPLLYIYAMDIIRFCNDPTSSIIFHPLHIWDLPFLLFLFKA